MRHGRHAGRGAALSARAQHRGKALRLRAGLQQAGLRHNVRFGDIFTEDQFPSETFDYFLSNPPFGVDWKKQQKGIQKEHEKRGFDGRFGAGLPRVNDGALLFLQHMWSKREDVKPKEHKEGSRLAIVFSGSPMFTGGAGSGESEIRRWLLENDWLEAIVALPESMFYNTGIGTYVWVVTNRKEKRRNWWKSEKARLRGPVPTEQLARERARRAGDGAGHLTPFDPVAVWWLDQRLARSAT